MGKEASLDKRIRAYVKKSGGLYIKLSPDFNKGIPDRLVVFPGGKVIFMELKAPKGVQSVIQQVQQERLLQKHIPCYLISSLEVAIKAIREQLEG